MDNDLTLRELAGIEFSQISNEDLEKHIPSFITIVEKIVEQNPNDYDLGGVIRKVYLGFKK